MQWLTSLHVRVLVFGCPAIGLAVDFGGRALELRFMPTENRAEEAHAIATALMTAFAAAFVLLTALTLANEVTSLSSAQTIVGTEAADASILAWSSTNPGVDTAPVQAALRNYLHATRTSEWRGSAAANGDDAATDNSLAANLGALTGERRLRLAAAGRSRPDFYAVLVIVTGLALIVNTSVVSIRSGLRAALVTTTLTVVIALSIAHLFALATPWRGAIEVSGHPIDAVIKDLNTNYFHR